MAEKDIKEKIQSSYEKYNSYDLDVWSLEFFDEESGGYVVVDLGRIEHSEKSKNEGGKYEKEFNMAKVYAKNGNQMEMMREASRETRHDVNINGIPAEMKKITGTNNIVKAASKAVNRQNARVVLFQFDTMSERVYLDLLKLQRKHYKILYFFTDEEIVYDLDTATPQQLSGRGGDTTAP